MKKLSILSLSALLSACQLLPQTSTTKPTSSDELDQRHFVGAWSCELSDGKNSTASQIQLSENNSIDYQGIMSIPKDKPLMRYELTSKGNWSFAENTLTFLFNENQVKRAQTATMKKEVQEDAQKQYFEKNYFAQLQKMIAALNVKPTPVKWEVSNFSQQTFKISQKSKSGVRTGQCVRPQA